MRNKFPFKLVILDNGSTDGTREYLLEHKDEIDKLILKPKNIGCIALNECIKHAEGNYISIQADDHILSHDWLETMYEAIKKVEEQMPNVGYLSSVLHYAIPKEGSLDYLMSHTVPYEHWFNNSWIILNPWKGTAERRSITKTLQYGNLLVNLARSVGNGGTIIPKRTFKRIGLFRVYPGGAGKGLRGLYDGEWRSRCMQYNLQVAYTPCTAFVHVKEIYLNPERFKQGFASCKPTPEQRAMMREHFRENVESARKSIPPPSAPKL